MAEVKQIVVKTNTGKKVKQLEERNKQLEEKVKQLEAEAVKGVQKGVEMVVSVVAEENERLKEQVKQLEEALEKMTNDWRSRCDVLEQVTEDRRAAEEECKTLEEQLEEQDAELEALRSTPNGTIKAELDEAKEQLEQKDELIKELEEQLEATAKKKKRTCKRGALKYPENSKWVKKLNEEQEELMKEIYDDTEETFTLKWDEENTKRNGSESYDIYERFKNETTALESKKNGMWSDEIIKAYVNNKIIIYKEGVEVDCY